MSLDISLTTSRVLPLELDNKNQKSPLDSCSLKWRQNKLWVEKQESPTDSEQNYVLPALKRQHWLKDCLKNSVVKQVCLDARLGETEVKVWADACQESQKKVFLRIPSDEQILFRHQKFCWSIKRIADWLAAAVILAVISPLIMAIALGIKFTSPGDIFFRQWRVGRRGKLFQVYKFRTMVMDAEQKHHQVMGQQQGLHKLKQDPRVTTIGKWLRKYSLDELPQLFNVLRGEMSLVAPRPWALYDALRLQDVGKERLNALPGITGAWQIAGRSHILDLEAVTKCDLEYLRNWSLTRDLKILLMTVPKVISGFGAY